MKKHKLNEVNAVHCVGIGGVGVSAAARFFRHRGIEVSGSDASMSPVVAGLKDEGIDVTVGHDADNVPADADVVVHSIAVPHNNPELNKAREAEIPTLTYPETIGLISESMRTLAVSGTHGKTTTTAMLADIFADSTRDPTVIVGSMLKDSHTNFVSGDDNLFVVEACEYKRSFHKLHPDILVITNIDNDHLDYFDDLADIKQAFATMIDKTADEGTVVCNPEGGNIASIIEQAQPKIVDYTEISIKKPLQVFGDHNYLNAQAAVAAARVLNIDCEVAKAAVANFTGTWRRAQKKGEMDTGAIVYDDYGHHPTEIKSTLAGFNDQFPDRELIVVFQPHLYSRTKELLDEFAGSFDQADQLFILPIYAARETEGLDVSSDQLTEKVANKEVKEVNAETISGFSEMVQRLQDCTNSDTLVVTQGAGDVYKVADQLTGGSSN
jgi:UDP-N-acetylmuramate--alanine ligase